MLGILGFLDECPCVYCASFLIRYRMGQTHVCEINLVIACGEKLLQKSKGYPHRVVFFFLSLLISSTTHAACQSTKCSASIDLEVPLVLQ